MSSSDIPHYNQIDGNPQERSLTTKSTNPKDMLGASRTPLHLIPGPAKVHQALAHLDGAKKYGPFNWREHGVSASIYKSAIERHLDDWFDGEDLAVDSRVHHLAHASAGINIILDSMAQGNFIDDRPTSAPTADMHDSAKSFIGGTLDEEYAYTPEDLSNQLLASLTPTLDSLEDVSDDDLMEECGLRGWSIGSY